MVLPETHLEPVRGRRREPSKRGGSFERDRQFIAELRRGDIHGVSRVMLGVSRRRGHLRALARGLSPLGGDVEEDALLSLVRSKAAHGNEHDAVVERVARHATERVRGGSAKRDAPGGIHAREGVPRGLLRATVAEEHVGG